MKPIQIKPIGIVHSPFKSPVGIPIQTAYSQDDSAQIEIFPEFSAGLKDIEEFSHLHIIYSFHLSTTQHLQVKPFYDDNIHGIFSVRAPARPNNIGLSIVQLERVEKNILHIRNVDMINNTPVLDIKPFVPDFDNRFNCRIGWLEGKIQQDPHKKSDDRFIENDDN
jgi:tRNA (adenine37-N6)-methyltransferase